MSDLATQLDAAFREHHNGYDDFNCQGCGADWYDDDGAWHLTRVVLAVLASVEAASRG